MADPFFLLTLTGSAIGFTLYFSFRRPRRTARPLGTRRRRAVGIPAALTIAAATAGGAVISDRALILEWWQGALALLVGITLYTWVLLVTPRWWRVPVVLLLAVPVVPAVDAWLMLSYPTEPANRECTEPDLLLRDNGSSRSEETTVALVRIDPPLGDAALMAVRVLPVVDVRPDSSQGTEVWQPAGEVGSEDSIRITVTFERYAPPLWWFPGALRIADMSVSGGAETLIMRSAPLQFSWVRVVLVTHTAELVRPDRSERFLQPGVYALEYSCGATDTENV